MAGKTEKGTQMRKVLLPILDRKGNPVSQTEINQIQEEYEFFDDTPLAKLCMNLGTMEARKRYYDEMDQEDIDLLEKYEIKIASRGSMIDYQKTLLDIAKQSKSDKGVDYEEGEEIRIITDKIEVAKPGGSVIFTEKEFKELSEKVKKPRFKQDVKSFQDFRVAFLESEQFTLEDKLSEKPEAGK